jgi:HK97 family phage major capsid protein
MANANSDTFTGGGWIPVGTDPNVILRIKQNSFVENYFSKVGMTTRTKDIPRSGGVKLGRVGKGDSFGRQTHANDSITMRVDKIGGIVEIDEEDIEDSPIQIIDDKTMEAADAYARLLDNAAIGVTASKSVHGWLYDSLYYTLTQSDSLTGYTANSNITKTGSGGVTYDNLSLTLGKLEQSNWFDPSNLVIAAHPFFAQALRGIKDSNQRPIFVESSAGMAGGAVGNANMTGMTLFGYPFQWSMGLRTSAAGDQDAAGNPLLVMGNRNLLRRGDRSELEVSFQSSEEGTGFDNDVNKVRFRARKGVAYGAPAAAAILEVG